MAKLSRKTKKRKKKNEKKWVHSSHTNRNVNRKRNSQNSTTPIQQRQTERVNHVPEKNIMCNAIHN